MKNSLGIFCFLILAASISFAGEVTTSANGSAATAALPHCVDDAATLAAIDQGRKQNGKNEFKYDAIKTALQSDSDPQLIARLIYSETLAANCADLNKEMVPAIAAVIQNRIVIRGGNVKSVIFQRDQFASSLNGYDESKWKEFLCPSDKALWEKSLTAAATKSTVNGANNYYLYKNSTKFSPPAWAKDPITFAGYDKIAPCVQLFATKFK